MTLTTEASAAAIRDTDGRSVTVRQVLALAAVLVLLGACVLALLLPTAVTTDVGWYLISTRMWLDGAELYADIIEVNPPLAFYLTVPAIWLHDTGWFDQQPSLFVYVSVLIAISLAMCCRLILKAGLEPVQAFLFALALFAALFLIPFADFGQREHLAIIFSLPYVVMSALFPGPSGISGSERFTVGLFAIPGLALKPFFLAMPAMVAVSRMAMGNSLRQRLAIMLSPENLAVGFGCLAYAVLVWFRHPAYFEIIIPLARTSYSGIEHEYAGFMRIAALFIFFGFPLLVVLWLRSAERSDRPFIILFSAAVGFAVSYLVQGKGWQYHAVPAIACAIAAPTFYAGSLLKKSDRLLNPVMALLIVTYVGVINPLVKGAYEHPQTVILLAEYEDRLTGRSIAGWTPKIESAFPLVNMTGSRWAMRYPSLWPLAGAVSASTSDDPQIRRDAKRVIADVRRNIVDDLIAYEPEIILLPTVLGEKFLDFLRSDARFEDAFDAYFRVDVVGEIEIWERSAI